MNEITQLIWGRKFWATGKPMNISTSNFPPHFDSHLHFFLNNSDQIISDQTFKQKLSNPYLIEHLFFLMWYKIYVWALGFRWTFTNVYFWMRSLHSNSRLKWYWKMIFICCLLYTSPSPRDKRQDTQVHSVKQFFLVS